MKAKSILFTCFWSVIFIHIISAQDTDYQWKMSEAAVGNTEGPMASYFGPLPSQYAMYQLDNWEQWTKTLSQAPLRGTDEEKSAPLTVDFPMPDGRFMPVRVLSTPVLQPGIAEDYPNLKTYTAIAIDDPRIRIKFELTPKGMTGAIFGMEEGTALIHPYDPSKKKYYSFFRKHSTAENEPFICGADHTETAETIAETMAFSPVDDCQLREYRLALACTGEFAQLIDDGDDSNGDITADVLADMVIVTSRLNGIFEREVGVTMKLIDRNEEIIFTDPDTDLYSNIMSSLPAENSTAMQITIGRDAFDIGHVFGSRGGGIAFLRGPCRSPKARGASGRSFRGPDDFVFDIVAHEVGHQFNGTHTQNNDCNRIERSSYEPGSGSTILSYARVCPPLVEQRADSYFHAISIEQMRAYIAGEGGDCAEILDANNSAPIADAGPNYNIPKGTPFILEGSATDADGDAITYCWEQFDNEFSIQPPSAQSTNGPSFRSFPPTPSPTRYVPRLSIVTGDEPADRWEVLPETGRTLNFRLTVRGNNGIFGCTDQSDMSIDVTNNAGPFTVLSPAGNHQWGVGDEAVIRWDVANTDQAPINCQAVDIFYSTDGGQSFPFIFAENIPNTGIYNFSVPDLGALPIKFMLRGTENIFFNISPGQVTLSESSACGNTALSTDIPVVIPSDGPSTVQSTIVIDRDEIINTVEVTDLVGTHEFLNEVSFSIISPQGTEVALWGQQCSQTEAFNLSFADRGTDLTCPVNVGQLARPQQPLSSFAGENARGTWTLQIEDRFAQDGGELLRWGLVICEDELTALPETNEKASIDIDIRPNPVEDILQLAISTDNSFNGQVQIFDAVQRLRHVSERIFTNGSVESIDVSYLNAGIYILQVDNGDNKIISRRFVKK